MNLGVGGATESWRTMFWVGAGMSFTVGFMRLVFPESKQFIEAHKQSQRGANVNNFRKNFWTMLKSEWRVCIYATILMSWFNWLSHTSQDSYTTFMLDGKGLNNAAASRASILMKTGACVGGITWGYLSQWIGRRRAIVLACLLCCCLIPAWVLPKTESELEAGGFFLQSAVQGAWGVAPIYLTEISPPAFRAIFVGMTYQLGNAISSPSTQMINALSENNFITNDKGKRVEAYGSVMAIATAIIAIGLAVTAAVGPEKKGLNFESAPAATTDGYNVASAAQLSNNFSHSQPKLSRTSTDADDKVMEAKDGINGYALKAVSSTVRDDRSMGTAVYFPSEASHF